MRTIGLDLGSQTGFAWTDDEKVHGNQSGVMDFGLRHYEGGGLRLLRFEDFLLELLRYEGRIKCYFEEVIWRPSTSGKPGAGDLGPGAAIYGEFTGILMRACELGNVPFEGLKVGQIKKHATGRGNANKLEMIEAAQKAFGLITVKDDQADALHILSLGLSLDAQTALNLGRGDSSAAPPQLPCPPQTE